MEQLDLMPDAERTPPLQSLAVTIPAITLWQPYACLIEIGAKPWETRAFACPKRLLGKRVAIHAAARKIRQTDFDDETFEAISDAFGFCNWNHKLPLGVVVCTAVIAESCRTSERLERDHFGDYSPGRFMWRLEDVRKIEPHIAAKGKQMIGWPWALSSNLKL